LTRTTNKREKFIDQIETKFEVSDIDQIVFEHSDGTEVQFSELFEYRASIGSGGFGFVVAALDKRTGEEIAIKLLRKEYAPTVMVDLFRKEAEILETIHNQSLLATSRKNSKQQVIKDDDSSRFIIGFKFFEEFSNFLLLGMEL
jgi:serine/threonine protein kinase